MLFLEGSKQKNMFPYFHSRPIQFFLKFLFASYSFPLRFCNVHSFLLSSYSRLFQFNNSYSLPFPFHSFQFISFSLPIHLLSPQKFTQIRKTNLFFLYKSRILKLCISTTNQLGKGVPRGDGFPRSCPVSTP